MWCKQSKLSRSHHDSNTNMPHQDCNDLQVATVFLDLQYVSATQSLVVTMLHHTISSLQVLLVQQCGKISLYGLNCSTKRHIFFLGIYCWFSSVGSPPCCYLTLWTELLDKETYSSLQVYIAGSAVWEVLPAAISLYGLNCSTKRHILPCRCILVVQQCGKFLPLLSHSMN